MLDINLVEIIKVAAVDAYKALTPANVIYGEVISTTPLKIKIDQKIILSEYFLVLTRQVSNYTSKIKVMSMEESDMAQNKESSFQEFEVKIENGLEIGDKVAMVMAQGGQSYLVLDKVVVK